MSQAIPPQVDDTSNSESANQGIRMGRVLGLVFALLLVGGLGFLANEWWVNRAPSRVKVTGRVTWNGKPVTVGAVMTRHVDYPKEAAIGAFDSEGKFELLSNGQPGAAVGTHKVIVASYKTETFPIPLVPSAYLKVETTPLSIEVTRDPAKNHFELEVKGEMPSGPRERDEAGESGSRPAEEPPAEGAAATGSPQP